MRLERGIPIPPKHGPLREQLKPMRVGHSVFVPRALDAQDKTVQRIAVTMRRLGMTPTVRRVSRGVRVWRIR